jgi:hypothetical protein
MISEAVVGVARFTPVARVAVECSSACVPAIAVEGSGWSEACFARSRCAVSSNPLLVVVEEVGCRVGVLGRVRW